VKIGEQLRYGIKVDSEVQTDQGMTNWWWLTAAPSGSSLPTVKLDRGISFTSLAGLQDARIPILLLRSSPHKAGSETTPWRDVVRPDQGFVRYFGDNRIDTGKSAHETDGNRRMLKALELQEDSDPKVRALAPPLLVFEGFPWKGKAKGQIRFQGLGVLDKAALLVQQDPKTGGNFTNFAFEIVLLDLKDDEDRVDWAWINARRDPALTIAQSNKLAPKAWLEWLSAGRPALERLQRRVIRRQVIAPKDQKPVAGSPEAALLDEIYGSFDKKKHSFEALANFVVSEIFRERGVSYRFGWITRGSGDEGIDFVAALDLDPEGEFASSRVVLLGQAKCENPFVGTSGLHMARLAARLRRGWFGAYVTTSFFSLKMQEEMLVDRYPVVLVHGLRLAQVVRRHLFSSGQTVEEFLRTIDDLYVDNVGSGDPELVLLRS
jgi:hypothetical protein